MDFFFFGFLLGVVALAGYFAWRWMPSVPVSAQEDDKALLVGFLAAHGEASVLDIRLYLEDYTHGQHDWTMRPERTVYRLLDQLVAEGAVVRRYDKNYGNCYRLAAPAERLIRVE